MTCARRTACRSCGSHACLDFQSKSALPAQIFSINSAPQTSSRKLRVFFFGGADGIAEAARRILNAENGGLTCVGTLNPGHGTIDDMSSDAIIAAINASNADFLVVALGASKGQAWLLRNHHRLRIPVRAHLGAAINFQAGSLSEHLKQSARRGWNGCGASRKNPISGFVTGMMGACCCAYCGHAYCHSLVELASNEGAAQELYVGLRPDRRQRRSPSVWRCHHARHRPCHRPVSTSAGARKTACNP